MPVNLLATRKPVNLLAGQQRDTTLSFRQGKPESTLGSIFSFLENGEGEKAKAANALTYSEMLNINPSVAYEYHDEISNQLREKTEGERIYTEKKGLGTAVKEGIDTSVLGMLANQKVPQPFESVDQLERWVNGLTTMAVDLPVFLGGMVAGGGPAAVSGWGGGFAMTSAMRQILVDRYNKGEVRSGKEWFERTGAAIKETIKGEVVGGFTGMAGKLSPVGWKAMSELSAMTVTGKLIEGELPTARDFVDNAAMLLVMHGGIKGMESAKAELPKVKAKLQQIFVKDGITPKEVTDRLADKTILPDETADVISKVDEVAKEIKQERSVGTPEKEIPQPQEGAGKTSIANKEINKEREARGLEPLESGERLSAKAMYELAKEKVDRGEIDPDNLTRKINNAVSVGETPIALTELENNAMAYRIQQLKNEHKFITDETEKANGKNVDALENRLNEIEVLRDATEKAMRTTGTEQSAALRSRQNVIAEDYSYSGLIQRAIDEGIDITPKLRNNIKDLSKKYSSVESQLKAYRTKTENKIKELEERIKNKDFSPKAKKEKLALGEEELTLQYKLDSVKREYDKLLVEQQLKNRGVTQIVKDSIVESLNLVRAIKSSFDVSAVGRQGFFAVISHPIKGFKNIPEMFRALKSDEAAYRINKEIKQRENYKLYEKAEVSLTEFGETSGKVEEIYRSRWSRALPGVGASERAFVSYLNLIRCDLFDSLYKSAFKGRKASDAELKALGNYVNQATGRGSIKRYEQALQGLGTVLWAPKLVLSRFQMLLGQGLWKGSAATRKAIAKEYARILTGLGVVYTVSSILGGDVETDPRSSDFGKIKIGNTRVDVLAGVSQAAVFTSRIISGEKKSLKTGIVAPIRGDYVPYGSANTWDVISNFMRTKLTPVIGIGINTIDGKDIIGNKVTLYDIPEQAIVPLAISDIYDAMIEEGVPAGAALGTLGMFGVGIQVHEQKGARP